MLHEMKKIDSTELQWECLSAGALVVTVSCSMLTSSQHLKNQGRSHGEHYFLRIDFSLQIEGFEKENVCANA